MRKQPMVERFWSKVDKRGPDDCWEWLACKGTGGYGEIRDDSSVMQKAHRVSWQLHTGEAPKAILAHICSNHSCVNPNHLFHGTWLDIRPRRQPKKIKPKPSLEERFWSKVNSVDGQDCWEWTANRMPAGYGHIKVNRKTIKAHRLSWILTNGPIPEGMLVCHRCDNPPCVRPDHLFLGNYADNARDAFDKGRRSGRKGIASRLAKLSEADVIEIKRLCDEGELPQSVIGELFGVSQTNISNISTGRTWAEVTSRLKDAC